jgi:hypothetical protein
LRLLRLERLLDLQIHEDQSDLWDQQNLSDQLDHRYLSGQDLLVDLQNLQDL